MDAKARNSKSNVSSRESMVIHSLKEGENWLMVQNENAVTSDDMEPMQISIVHDPSLSLFFDNGASVGNCNGRNENTTNEGRMEINHKRDQHHENKKKCLFQSLRVLCIDVDSTAQCIAVKDIRRGQSETIETDPHNNKNNNSSVADRLKFSLLRRKRKDKKSKKGVNMNHTNRESVHLTEQDRLASASEDAHSSGYTTDDEKVFSNMQRKRRLQQRIMIMILRLRMDCLQKKRTLTQRGILYMNLPNACPLDNFVY